MKMLYLIQTPWKGVLQRSQVIELGIEKFFDCEVIDKKYYPMLNKRLNNLIPKKIVYIPQLRGCSKVNIIYEINKCIYKYVIKKKLKSNDAVWLCSPDYMAMLPDNYDGVVIYDCMDDHVALATPKEKKRIQALEKKLIDRADVLFASSAHLMQIKPGLERATLIRNGFIAENIYTSESAEYKTNYKIGYIGTIDFWFDFQALLESTQKMKNIEYHLFGPYKDEKINFGVSNNKKYLSDNRVFLDGVVKHEELYDAISDFDALIMPFKVNDVILSVDPVKLYEYISFGKCVISVWYPEVDRFSPYVYFYKNTEEYLQLISELSEKGFPPKYTAEMQHVFLSENSWEKRCEDVVRCLEEKFGKLNNGKDNT